MKNIAVFASGNGSNAENLIKYFNSGADSTARVVLVVCNNPAAAVMDKAIRLGVDTSLMSKQEINNSMSMLELMDRYNIDIIVLAGFLLKVPDFLVDRYEGRMVNIHPSLLPKFGGKGMYGQYVHEAVVAAGEKITGITIHLVNGHYDDGQILFQATTPVSPTDTADDVAAKIHILEQKHFPTVVRKLIDKITQQQ